MSVLTFADNSTNVWTPLKTDPNSVADTGSELSMKTFLHIDCGQNYYLWAVAVKQPMDEAALRDLAQKHLPV
jgi:hypothetical protein